MYGEKKTVKTFLKLDERTDETIRQLTDVWEQSVRASHDFLNEKDILAITPDVITGLKYIHTLIVAKNEDKYAGFMGIQDDKIEMLFLNPEYFGLGLGKQFIALALDTYKVNRVDVNEQNPKALRFYERCGFTVYQRDEIDGQGNPFPILRMRLNKDTL